MDADLYFREDQAVKTKPQYSSGSGSSTTDTKYVPQHNSIFTDTGNTQENVQSLNSIIEERNAEDEMKSKIHGLSEQEYDEYQAIALKLYGIKLEDLSVGNFQSVAVSVERMIGTENADTIAASYDSTLDLVLDQKFNDALEDIFGEDCTMVNWDRIMGKADILKEKYGISIEKTGNRMFWVSLVDENGNVIKDEDGNLAQVKKSDNMMPDGLAQKNEIFASGILDMMGYDCVSFLDLSPEEYEQIKAMAQMDNSELGTSSGMNAKKARDNFLKTEDIKKADCADWIENERAAYWKDFEHKRDSGYYNGRTNTYTGEKTNYYHKSHGSNGGNDDSMGEIDNTEITETTNTDGRTLITKSQYEDKVQQLVDKGKTETAARSEIDKFYIVKDGNTDITIDAPEIPEQAES